MTQFKPLSSAEQQLLKESLRDNFDPKVVRRGKMLFKEDKVGAVRSEHDPMTGTTTYAAGVLGSKFDRYDTQVEVDFEYGVVEGTCSCPYEYDCKHSVALIHVLLAEESVVEPSEPHIDKPEQWLKAFQEALAPTLPEAEPKSWHLCYLVHLNENEPELALVERYRKKDGDWGRFQPISPAKAEHRHPLLAADRELLELLKNAPAHWQIRNRTSLDSTYPLKGVLGRQILEWALRSGRALDDESLTPLNWGQERTLAFVWRADKNGQRLMPALSPELEADWQLLDSVVPPLYRSGRTLGAAHTPLNPDQLALIRRMPAVSDHQKTDISVHLHHRHQQSLTTEAPLPDVQELSEAIPVMRFAGATTPVSGVLPALRFQVRYGDLFFSPEYDQARARADKPSEGRLVDTDSGYVRLARDWAAEAEWTRRLRALPLVPYRYDNDQGEVWVPSEVQPARHVMAWNRLLPALTNLMEAEGWELDIEPGYRVEEAVAQLSGDASDAGHGWFDLRLNLHLDGVDMDTETLLSEWLKAGTPESMALRGDDEHWVTLDMRPLAPVLGLLRELYQRGDLGKPMRLPSFKAIELDAIENINVKQAPALKKLRRELKNFKGLAEVSPSKQLKADLRDYQRQGLNWLVFLHRYGFGGILADDMGLGKTLQTLAFLQRLKAGRKLQRGALIVAPTSLIWNWQKEAERFTPNLRCLVLHGADRHTAFETLADHDLIITTYALIHRDFDVHSEYPYDVCVLDEAQNIKNRHAKTTRRVKQLPADMRLCLTGTPLENHLGELWSIADFVLPGLLGDDRQFQDQFRQPIEQHGDEQRAQELSRRMAPFMLRRTKADVVKELPAKTEIQQTVHLEGKQQALYESIRVSMEQRVRQLIREKGVAKSRIEFLDALLKLRQACIDPRLVKLKKAVGIEHSAKMGWLLDALPEMVEEGRKILLFSQFTTMLDLIDRELSAQGIDTVKLTGRTRKREVAIAAFQEGSVPVFLISLKAGGAGLNLTAAERRTVSAVRQ